MSDNVIIANAVLAFFSTVFTGIIALFIARLNQKQTDAAAKAEVVRTTLDTRHAETETALEQIQKVGVATHTLVNSNMEVQLHVNELLAARVAELTGDPKDVQAADLAKRLHAEHQKKQAQVDAKTAREAQSWNTPRREP